MSLILNIKNSAINTTNEFQFIALAVINLDILFYIRLKINSKFYLCWSQNPTAQVKTVW